VRFAFIAERAELGVTRLCRSLSVSRSGFYAWRTRAPSAHETEDNRLKALVYEAYLKGRKVYGSPRVHRSLAKQQIFVSRKRVSRLMRETGLVGRVRRRYRCTTMSDHGQPVAANILGQVFAAEAPNRRWVSDTTELLIPNGRLFLAVVLDLFSRFLVGWALSTLNDRHLTLKALDMALRRRCPGAGLLHHSDQGCTYASEDYQQALAQNKIVCSMSRRGNCYDNAAMESWNSIFKSEVGERFDGPGDAKVKVFDYIEGFYNPLRMHSSIDYMSPAEFERAARMKAAA
jgi:putative transposase